MHKIRSRFFFPLCVSDLIVASVVLCLFVIFLYTFWILFFFFFSFFRCKSIIVVCCF